MRGFRKFTTLAIWLCLLFVVFVSVKNILSTFSRDDGDDFDDHSLVKIPEPSAKWKANSRSYLDGFNYDSVKTTSQHQLLIHDPDFIWKEVILMPGRKRVQGGRLAVNCRMSNCFNFDRCRSLFTPKGSGEDAVIKVHIYPSDQDKEMLRYLQNHNHNVFKTSSTYRKILNVIVNSPHFEPNASKACLFIPRFDTLDRDPLSPDFVKHLAYHFLPEDDGRNHLIFNLYSGSWPDYHEVDFSNFNPLFSMLVKASFSRQHFRPGFDISLPLISKNHPERDEGFDPAAGSDDEDRVSWKTRLQSIMNQKKQSLLVFKGKRYIYGIGSDTRNSLHHLHNDRDVLMYTTCKHGKKWKQMRDERCEKDNLVYESVDYQSLMENSTFCLIPRGRRLGSFRFLESLSLGCIPVILSNDWVLPFDEVIDWSGVVVSGDERALFQLPELLRTLEDWQINAMRVKCLAIYDTYFSSVEKIVLTTLKIVSERIRSWSYDSSSFYWNLVKTDIICHNKTSSARQDNEKSENKT